MELQVLGTGCPKCEKLLENVKQAVAEINLDCRITKVTDINEIITYGVMSTPALAVDGKVKVVGKVPSVEEIKGIIG